MYKNDTKLQNFVFIFCGIFKCLKPCFRAERLSSTKSTGRITVIESDRNNMLPFSRRTLYFCYVLTLRAATLALGWVINGFQPLPPCTKYLNSLPRSRRFAIGMQLFCLFSAIYTTHRLQIGASRVNLFWDDTVRRLACNVPAAWRRRGFTAVRTGAKLANSHKLSGELLPRLRQTLLAAGVIHNPQSINLIT